MDIILKVGLTIPLNLQRAHSLANEDMQVPLGPRVSLAVSQMAYKRAWPYPCHCIITVAENKGSRQHEEAKRTWVRGSGFKVQVSSTLLKRKKKGANKKQYM